MINFLARKSINDKIIILIAVISGFFWFAESVYLYLLIKSEAYEQVIMFSESSFSSFGNNLDQIFYEVEALGEKYRGELIANIIDGELNDNIALLTRAILESSPYIAEIAVIMKHDIEYKNATSFFCYKADKGNIPFPTQIDSRDISNNSTYNRLLQLEAIKETIAKKISK
jgi:hypothetical protein